MRGKQLAITTAIALAVTVGFYTYMQRKAAVR